MNEVTEQIPAAAPEQTPDQKEDQAWASVVVPLDVETTLALCHDVIRLFRINPMIYYTSLKQLDDNRYAMQGRNTSQEPDFEFDIRFSVEKLPDGLRVVYDKGIKRSTRVTVEADALGAKITLTDDYSGLGETEREARLNEVDKSLLAWARSIQEYALGWKRWSWCGPWRWYMRKIWQGMNPSGRRITYMLIWITVAEVVAFLMIFMIFWFEFDEYFPG